MKASLISAFFLLVATVAPATSQTGTSLNDVEALLAEGRISEARETLGAWWEIYRPAASRADRQRGIWLRGKLTVDPEMAESDFRRLVLEYPGGLYSDDALLRLGLLAEARGDGTEALEHLRSLTHDYPSSPLLGEAEDWIRRLGGQSGGRPSASRRGRGRGGDPPVAEGRGNFSVQLGAFRDLERALSLADRLREEGYRPRLVRIRGTELARVRIGRFEAREGAESLARELRARDFEVTLVTDAHREERVG